MQQIGGYLAGLAPFVPCIKLSLTNYHAAKNRLNFRLPARFILHLEKGNF